MRVCVCLSVCVRMCACVCLRARLVYLTNRIIRLLSMLAFRVYLFENEHTPPLPKLCLLLCTGSLWSLEEVSVSYTSTVVNVFESI